jgi:hypothetical protein
MLTRFICAAAVAACAVLVTRTEAGKGRRKTTPALHAPVRHVDLKSVQYGLY